MPRGTVSKDIDTNIHCIENLKKIIPGIEFEVHENLPSLQIFIVDDWCVFSFYLMNTQCHSLPQIEVKLRDNNKNLTLMGTVLEDHIAALDSHPYIANSSPYIRELHHVNMPVKDLTRSKEFYKNTLGLTEIDRPDFGFPGAWFSLPSGQHIHLVENSNGTFREPKFEMENIQPADIHFALRVDDDSQRMKIINKATQICPPKIDPFKKNVNFTQIYILDPDAHIIEITTFTSGTKL